VASNRAPVRRPRGEGLPRRWWFVALALFLALDIALVVFALNANRTSGGAGGQTPAPPSSTSPAPSATATPAVAPRAAVPQRLLAAVSADVAWRGAIGACPDGPSALEYTNDGGETWNLVDPAPATGATALVRVIPVSPSEANVVSLDGDCAPQLVGTFVAGDAWEDYSSNLGSYWFVNPSDRSTIHSPDGTVAAPCGSVVSIATRSSSDAVVLCADQTVFETITGGKEWSAAITVPGAVAVDVSADSSIVAVSAQGECAGISVVTLTDASPSAPLGCLGEVVAPGQTALAVADDGTLWLWAGEIFARSTDGGATWR
jgi:photosystem II stability/assembly factor-like uncharacterized protein